MNMKCIRVRTSIFVNRFDGSWLKFLKWEIQYVASNV